MKICDRCGCETKELNTLMGEFDAMEVCEPCQERLLKRIVIIADRCDAARQRLRRKAFEHWKGDDPMPIRVRRWWQFFTNLLAALTWTQKEARKQ